MAGRIPGDAQTVFAEIVVELRALIKETPFVKRDRLRKEFSALHQGNRPHHEFYSLFNEMLLDMTSAGVESVDNPQALYDAYLSKISLDLRSTVMGQRWPLDGDDKPERKCTTWQDVADACGMELATRTEFHAPDGVNALGGGGKDGRLEFGEDDEDTIIEGHRTVDEEHCFHSTQWGGGGHEVRHTTVYQK